MKRFVAALLVGCHAPGATSDPMPAPTTSTSTSTSASAAPLPTPIETAPLASTTSPLAASDAAVAPAPKYIDDVTAWLAARNAKLPRAFESGSSCTEEKIGANDALLCHGLPDSIAGGESVYPITVWIVANGRADLALTAASGAGPLDREIFPNEPERDDMYVEFDVTLSGTTLTIAERPKKTCTQVLAQYTTREWDGHRRVVQKACAARGRYVLQNGKLVRAP